MVDLLNYYGKNRTPILFIIDFELKNFYITPLSKLKDTYFFIDGFTNFDKFSTIDRLELHKSPIDFDRYKIMFDRVIEEIKAGNTYLLNLCTSTDIESEIDIFDIFRFSKAKFKLFYQDRFTCFSPERFIKIEQNRVYTYPMKGTIDSKIENAKELILNNQKELAEHTMVVDLLRNDIGIVANSVKVENFRYIDEIIAGDKTLFQVSSKIRANLKHDWQNSLGEILCNILPAGSISGTPKKSTVELIKSIENHNREFFSGIFGYFDGDSLDSAVMIRFIEKKRNKLIYKSGGGITIDSDPFSEYRELIDKVYIPI